MLNKIRNDIYSIERREVLLIDKLKNNKDLSERNKGLFLKYFNQCNANGISKLRCFDNIERLTRMAKMINKDFDKSLVRDDMVKLVSEIKNRQYNSYIYPPCLS